MTVDSDSFDTNPGTTPRGNKESLLDSLRETSKAWLSAGSALGDVVEDFAARYRRNAAVKLEDGNDDAQAAAADTSGEGTESATTRRLKSLIAEAREKISTIDDVEDIKRMTAELSGNLEDLARDLGASARGALASTRDNAVTDDARVAFNAALGQVRSSFEETATKARAKLTESGHTADAFIDDLRDRLETMVTRARIDDRFFEIDDEDDDDGSVDYIDGEVVDERP